MLQRKETGMTRGVATVFSLVYALTETWLPTVERGEEKRETRRKKRGRVRGLWRRKMWWKESEDGTQHSSYNPGPTVCALAATSVGPRRHLLCLAGAGVRPGSEHVLRPSATSPRLDDERRQRGRMHNLAHKKMILFRLMLHQGHLI